MVRHKIGSRCIIGKKKGYIVGISNNMVKVIFDNQKPNLEDIECQDNLRKAYWYFHSEIDLAIERDDNDIRTT